MVLGRAFPVMIGIAGIAVTGCVVRVLVALRHDLARILRQDARMQPGDDAESEQPDEKVPHGMRETFDRGSVAARKKIGVPVASHKPAPHRPVKLLPPQLTAGWR